MINFKFKSEIIKQKKEHQEKMREEINKYNEKRKEIIIFKKMYIPFQLKDKYNSTIPLNLFTCWHTKNLPPIMKLNYDKLVNNHRNFNHFLEVSIL